MGDAGNNDFDWRKALRFIERKLEAQEAKTRELEVLIVDDDDNDTLLLTEELNHFYCHVTVCHDSVEASKLIATRKFDIAFIDQKMPKLTGLELIQKSFPDKPTTTNFVIVTGFSDSPMIEQTLKVGAVLAPKPLNREKLTLFLRPRNDR